MGLIEYLPAPNSNKKGWPWNEETATNIYDEGKSYPKITIITPSFNQGAFIEETIRSVLLQNYSNLEYIIIDGGSSDETVEIIKKYEPWITYWVSEHDEGQSDAINKGLKISTGDIFNWLNSDDFYEKGALKAVSDGLDENTDVFIGRFFGLLNEQKTISDNFITSNNIFGVIASARFHQPATFFKLAVIKAIGGVNIKYNYCMDLDLWIRYLLMKGHLKNIKNVNIPLCNFRIHEESKTGTGFLKFQDEHYSIYSTLNDLPLINVNQDELAHHCNLFFLNRAWELFNIRELVRAKVHFKRVNVKLLLKENDKNRFRELSFKIMFPSFFFKAYDKIKNRR